MIGQESALGADQPTPKMATAAAPPTMIGGILDHNGNMLMGMEQINERLFTLLEKLTGPQPRNLATCDEEKPQGTLHTVMAQQTHMDAKLREMISTIEQIEQLM